MTATTSVLSRFALVGAAIGALVLPGAVPAMASFPGVTGRISFQQAVCDEPAPDVFVCRSDIVTAKPDGSDRLNITNVPDENFAVLSDWSKDGTRIAYDLDDGQTVQTWVANANGSGKLQVTSGDGFAGDPAWNPAGTMLAVDADWNDYPASQGIWVIPVRAGVTKADAVRLTATPFGTNGFDSEPAWSPDGTTVAFTRFKNCHFREKSHGRQAGIPNGCPQAIFTVKADGTGGPTQLTPWGMVASYPNWSPDGTKITFDGCDSGKTGCRGDIWVMNTDGSGMTRLTRSPNVGGLGNGRAFDLRNNPDFSPDGQSIMFTHWCDSGGLTELLRIPASGGAETTVIGCDGIFRNKVDWGSAA